MEFLTLKESFLLSQIYEAKTNKNSNFNPTWTSIQTCASRTKTNWNVERKKKSQLKTEANVLWCLWGRKYLKTFFCFTPLNLSDVLSGNLSFCMLWQVICSAALFPILSFPPKLSSISCPVRHFIFLCYLTVNYFSISTAMSAFLFHFYVFIFSFCIYQIALKHWSLIAFLGKTFLAWCGLFHIVNFYGF